MYTFDGEEYHKTFESLEDDIAALGDAVEATRALIGNLPEGSTVVEYVDGATEAVLLEAKAYADDQVELHIVD